MDAINERFKAARKECGKSQESWGTILGITRAGVCDIEAGRRSVTEKHIKLLSVDSIDGKFLNEEWLRTGKGEMFIPLSRDEEIARFAGEMIKEDDTFKKKLISVLARLDEKDWEDLERIAKNFIKKD